MKLVVSTHLPFTDTVTLHDGFVVEEQYDTSLDRSTSTTNGLLESAAANGVVRVTTVAGAPITKNDTDDYPYAGTVQVKGINSTLQMTVLSTSNVRLDLDADGNGSFESTETVAWDWLL
jgi:nitrogen fixation protein FixH